MNKEDTSESPTPQTTLELLTTGVRGGGGGARERERERERERQTDRQTDRQARNIIKCRSLPTNPGRREGDAGVGVGEACKLQALVYDILPSTTAVFSYAIGPRKLSANEQFFCCFCCSNSSKFDTNNSDYIRRLLYS